MQTTLSSKIQIILTDAYTFFGQHFFQIAALCLPFIFATTLSDFMLGAIYRSGPMALVAPLALNLLVYPIYTAALIQLMARRARKEHPKNGDLIMAALQQWVPLLMLKAIMVFLVGLGISLLIVPGIWLGVRLAFAEFYLVLFGMTPKEAIIKSLQSTRNQFLLILILFMATYVPILLLGLTTDQIVRTIAANDFFRIIVNAGWSLIGLLVHVVLFRAFMQVLSEQKTESIE
ncbi:MAG: hypothetical protein C4519_23690 [Desulfobacteraceae bacterium]|nr:MAG: hypothetical protein C4519_23690 [Desulfobacteraceae bacterium]